MMINLWPVDGVHFVAVDEDIIILDVEADQYSCLLNAAAWMTLTEDGAIIVSDDQSASELRGTGLATPERPAQVRLRPTEPRRERTPATGGHPLRILKASLDLLAATLAFRGKHFSDLIQPVGAAPWRTNSSQEHVLTTVLRSYRSALPWIPFEGECLQRAFQLRRILMREGIATDWVFGVRTWPFGAHCWLQIGDEIIGDSLARVSHYSPIMVV